MARVTMTIDLKVHPSKRRLPIRKTPEARIKPNHGVRSRYKARNISVAHPFFPKEVFAWDERETGSAALAARINSQRAKHKSSPPMSVM
jgi:hypothetical protein